MFNHSNAVQAPRVFSSLNVHYCTHLTYLIFEMLPDKERRAYDYLVWDEAELALLGGGPLDRDLNPQTYVQRML